MNTGPTSQHEARIRELEQAVAERTAEAEQRSAELAVINSVQEGLVAELDMEAIYDLVGDRVRDLFDAQVVVIRTFDHEAGLEHFPYVIEKGERLSVMTRPVDAFAHHLMRLRAPLLINEGFEEYVRPFSDEASLEGEVPQSALFVPLVVGDEVKGNVSLQNVDREHAFSDSDVRLLSTLANSMSVALENARLFAETTRLLAETEQRNAELAVINGVQEGLVAELDMQAIYDLVGDRVRDLFDAQSVMISTFDHNAGLEQLRYNIEKGEKTSHPPRSIDLLRRRLIETREPIHINEGFIDALVAMGYDRPAPVPGTKMPQSVLFVPLVVGETVRGYVSLQNVDREHAFSESDVRLLSTLANSMSVALENARLFAETTRLLGEVEQRAEELAVINGVQEGLVAELDMQAIYDLVGDRVRDLFDAQVVIIRTFDYEQQAENFRYFIEKGERFYPESVPADAFTHHLMGLRAPVLINEDFVGYIRRFDDSEAATAGEVPQSALFVPLVVGDAVKGNVSLQNVDREGAFSEEDVRLLSTLANSMSVALENARLFAETTRLLAETEQRNAELAVINGVQEGLVAELDMQAIYDLVGDRVRDLFDAQIVIIATFDHAAGLEHQHYAIEKGEKSTGESFEIDLSRQQLIETRELILINEGFIDALVAMGIERPEPVPGTKMPQSVLFVPLVVGESVRGYVSLQNVDREGAFSDSDVRLLSTLANSMSVALENARLFDETTRLLGEVEQRAEELAVINGVQEGLVAELDMQAIYDLVGDRVRDLFDAQTVVIRTFDYDAGLEQWRYAIEKGERQYIAPRPFDDFARHLIEIREPDVVNEDFVGYIGRYSDEVAVEGEDPKSAIFVPMIVGGTVRGNVSLQNVDREHAFSESDVRVLTTLTNSMSVALENARLFAATRQQATELDTVNEVSRALVSQLDFDALVHLVGEQMRQTFSADIVYVALLDREAGMIRFPYVYGETLDPMAYGEGLTSQIIRTREPLLINHDVRGRTEELGIERVGKQAASYLGVPILAGDEAVGVISVQTTEAVNRFDADDLRLLGTIAANVGVALQNAESYRKLGAALKDLKQAQAQLVQQEKLASLGALTAGIAHEIKNPLNFVTNFAEVNDELAAELAEELAGAADPDEVAALIADIRQNARLIVQHGQRADSIVKSMMAHARGGEGERTTIDLNGFVDEYIDLAYHGQRARVPDFNADIVRDYDESAGEVEMVPQEVGRVLINLLGNAFDAVHEHAGKTKGQSNGANGQYAPRVEVTTRRVGHSVEVRVADNGGGMAEAVKAKIFEPFYTTKPTGQGTGLGLSMSHDIITQGHGGALEVESAPGEGAAFVITLPAEI